MSATSSSSNQASALSRDWSKHLWIWVFLSIELLPLYMMFQISFKDNSSFLRDPWFPSNPAQWQWGNYAFGWNLIWPYIANTVFVATTSTVISLSLSLFGAYFFARYKMPGSRFLWGAFLFLMLMPSVASLVPLFNLLKNLHLLNSLWALIIVNVAGAQTFNIFILRNFIEDIPRDLFEAAEIDGASHTQQVLNIVIPMSGSIIATLAILSFLACWNDFILPLIVLRDQHLFTLGVGLIYLNGEYVKQWGKIMAAFFVASIPLIIMFLFTMKLFVKGLSSGAVKG